MHTSPNLNTHPPTLVLFASTPHNNCAGGLIDACTQAASGTVTPAQAQATLNNLLVEVMGVLLVGGLFSGIRAYMFNAAAERVMCRLRVQLFSKVGRGG